MAKKGTWEYQCPQFVDFAAGLDSSGKDDVFFDCQSTTEVDEVFRNLRSPDIRSGANFIPEVVENNLMSKMSAAFLKIENTPKYAVVRKQRLETANSKKPQWRYGTKSSVQASDRKVLGPSKSVTNLNTIVKKPVKSMRKSSSMSDLRTITKKQTYPATPMCLKRTIKKTNQKMVKSTEEMELEEIARLQKELRQHLRYNEMSLKKLNLKPRQGVSQKNNYLKPENVKGLNPPERRNFCQGKTLKDFKRRDLKELSHEAFREEVKKIAPFTNKLKYRQTEKFCKDEGSNLKKATENKEKESVKAPSRTLPQTKLGFHSGVFFHDSVKKTTVIQPFNFSYKPKEKNDSKHAKFENAADEKPAFQSLKLHDGKENIPVSRVRPLFVKNNKGTENQRVDSNKVLESAKRIIDLRSANRMRGLSENLGKK